jgi:predicted dehydrogenase
MKGKVGIIGCGHISDSHIKSWRKANYGVVFGVFDLNEELARKKAEKYAIDRVYSNLDKIIEDCDILDVCTPPGTHFEIAMKIIKSGKHLLIEKPIVTDLAQWELLKSNLRNSNSKLAVLHNLKFTKAVLKGKQIIDSGRIGKVIRINRYFLTHPDHDRMLVGNSHWSHKLPGGRWFETMPHELYLTHFYAGESQIENISVISTKSALSGAKADEVCITLKNDQCITNFHYSSNCIQNKRYIEVVGTSGTFVIDILSDMLFLDKIRENKTRRAVGIMMLEAYSRIIQGIPDRVRYFLDKLQGVSPHTRIILQFDEFIVGKAENPTPLNEVDYVVVYCDKIGKELEEQLQTSSVI